MIVMDTPAILAGLLNDGQARQLLATASVHTPVTADTDVLAGLRALTAAGTLTATAAAAAAETWSRLGVRRHPLQGLLGRVWEVSAQVGVAPAAAIALAEVLGYPLVTIDRSLAALSGIRCPLTTVPN